MSSDKINTGAVLYNCWCFGVWVPTMASEYDEKATAAQIMPTKKKIRVRVDIGDRSLMVITERSDTVSKFGR